MPVTHAKRSPWRQSLLALIGASLVSVALFAYGAVHSHSLQYDYLLWNLFLAAIPLVFALRLAHVLRFKRWSAWEPIGWSLLWLLFVPNSFYMVSDYIHLRSVPSSDILYTAVLFTSFILLALLLGFCSLYIVHHELRRRIRPLSAALWIAATLLICSFAIYIGRDLRWNSWDIITNPGGLLFDVSDRLLRPKAYPDMLRTIASFFVLLGSLYGVMWQLARLLRQVGAHEFAEQVRRRQNSARS